MSLDVGNYRRSSPAVAPVPTRRERLETHRKRVAVAYVFRVVPDGRFWHHVHGSDTRTALCGTFEPRDAEVADDVPEAHHCRACPACLDELEALRATGLAS